MPNVALDRAIRYNLKGRIFLQDVPEKVTDAEAEHLLSMRDVYDMPMFREVTEVAAEQARKTVKVGGRKARKGPPPPRPEAKDAEAKLADLNPAGGNGEIDTADGVPV
jgi:hypothetical protein